jgi:fatty-acyl-CoA synthase
MMSIASTLEWRALRQPDAEAVVFGDRRVSNAQLLGRVRLVARALIDSGVERGDVVALLLKNRLEFLELILATNAVGATWLPLNFRLAADEWRYILDHAGARALVTELEFHEPIGAIRDQLASLSTLWTVDEQVPTGWHGYEQLLERARGAPLSEFAELGLQDVQRLMYTSGTTSRPKGVPITYGNLHWKNVAHIVEFGLTADDRTLIAGPLYHVGGLDLPATGVFYAGGSLVVLPRFDPELVMRTIERERITNVWLPPSMVNMVLELDAGDRYDVSSLRLIISGGEKMPEPLVEKILRLFPDTWFADAYGLTETVSGDTFLDRGSVLAKLGSVGRPVPHLEIRIEADDGHELTPGETGEICLRGPKVFSGYWRDPDATATALRDGWFHTGDVGRLDSDGYLYVEDRKKDLIISGGENVASPEVERVLYEHPGVLEAAVIGQPHQRWGEVPMAFVVRRPEHELSESELIDFCSHKLARFKVPKRVEFIDALPRTPSGKVLKRILRERLTLEPQVN